MIRPKKKLEEMSIEELKEELARVNKKSGFKPRKLKVSENGAFVLDMNNPHDREWWEDDYY